MAGPLRLRVRITPRSGRDRIEGLVPDAAGGEVLKVRVSAPPVGGAANAALVRLLAKVLGTPRSAVTVVAGETARIKTVEIAGDPEALSAQIDAVTRREPPGKG